MSDPRIKRLAEVLVDHSCRLKSGDRVLIETFDLPNLEIVVRLVELAAARGAIPIVDNKSNAVLRALYLHGAESSIALAGDIERSRMQQMSAYIGIRGSQNANEFSGVPSEAMDRFQRLWWHRVHSEIRVNQTRWVVLRYPTPSFAQAAQMGTEDFEEFYFRVCTADYEKMARKQAVLAKRMEATDRVEIWAPGTKLTFSKKAIPVIPCSGGRNIPDGEVFTAPVRDSINGEITYNAPSRYQGTVFEKIHFEFENGKIVRADAGSQTTRLNQILDSDQGARYIGEWSIGCNYHVKKPMLDTLFDEKIGGSIHLTPGQAYEIADNGNRSQVHWDLVLIMTPEYGGGEILFDGEVISRDGQFIPEDLQPLNTTD